MAKGKRGQFVIEVNADALRVAIIEGLLNLSKPPAQSDAEAWADMKRRSPDVAAGADRAATNVMIVVAQAAAQGRKVQ